MRNYEAVNCHTTRYDVIWQELCESLIDLIKGRIPQLEVAAVGAMPQTYDGIIKMSCVRSRIPPDKLR